MEAGGVAPAVVLRATAAAAALPRLPVPRLWPAKEGTRLCTCAGGRRGVGSSCPAASVRLAAPRGPAAPRAAARAARVLPRGLLRRGARRRLADLQLGKGRQGRQGGQVGGRWGGRRGLQRGQRSRRPRAEGRDEHIGRGRRAGGVRRAGRHQARSAGAVDALELGGGEAAAEARPGRQDLDGDCGGACQRPHLRRGAAALCVDVQAGRGSDEQGPLARAPLGAASGAARLLVERRRDGQAASGEERGAAGCAGGRVACSPHRAAGGERSGAGEA
mmetsp:Transcript_23709/g.70113  ORF Transcript_23709/g.70113 Transcript_23709/m.70113 type:complete len:275 (+) Transcript_23709:344-1168(+)